MQKKGNAYLDGTVHVGKEVQTIQRYKLELYMWEKRYKPVTGTVHVGKCFPVEKLSFYESAIFFCFIPMKISQHLSDSKDTVRKIVLKL